MEPREQILRQKPTDAVLFQLVLKAASGQQITYPAEGRYYGTIHQMPVLAPATYTILYFDIECKRLEAPGAKVTFAHYHSIASKAAELPLFDEESAAAPAPPRTGQPQPSATQPPTSSGMAHAAGSSTVEGEWTGNDWKNAATTGSDTDQDEEDEEDDEEDDEEEDEEDKDEGEEDDERDQDEVTRKRNQKRRRLAEKREAAEVQQDIALIRLQQEIQEKNTKLLRETLGNKEVAEVHALQGVQRREMVESQRLATLGVRREWDTIQKGTEILVENYALLDSTFKRSIETFELVQQKARQQLTAPPPPQTDWGPIMQVGIESIAGILRQILPVNGVRELPPKTPSNRLPVLNKDEPVNAAIQAAPPPAAQSAPASSSSAPSSATGPEPPHRQKLEQLAKRFAQMDDGELVRRMSSPEDLIRLLAEVNTSLGDDQ